MNSENDQWNIADNEFSLWLYGKKQDGSRNLTDILKSTYLVFSKEQRFRLETICKKSFDYLQKKVKEEEKKKLARTLELTENSVMFSVSKSEYGHWLKLTEEKNEKIINGILSKN